MQQDPTIKVNWSSGEATFHVGSAYKKAYPLLKFDVMSDIAFMVDQELEKARELLNPGRAAELQLRENARRAHWAGELSGMVIKSAEALANGHLALELGDGRVVVVCGGDSVDVCEFDSFESLRGRVQSQASRYLKLPAQSEREDAISSAKFRTQAQQPKAAQKRAPGKVNI